MINHGYQYVNIDDCWAVKPGSSNPGCGGEPRDASGKVNANARFPDMRALTDYIHARGLKAGIYTSPGRLICARCSGAYEHEAADAERFAEWGFDFLKYDWCSYGQLVTNRDVAGYQKPYRLMGELLHLQVRDIVFNICNGLGGVWTWGKDMEDGTKAAGLFNRGEYETEVTARWADLGVRGKQTVRDLWRQRDIGDHENEFTAMVARHGVVLLRVRAQ